MCKQGPFSRLVEGRRCPNRFLGFGGDCPIGGRLDWKRQLVPRISSLYRKDRTTGDCFTERAQRGLRHACRSYGSARRRPSGGSGYANMCSPEHVEMMISEKQRPFYTSKAIIPCKKYADGGRSGQSGATPGAANC